LRLQPQKKLSYNEFKLKVFPSLALLKSKIKKADIISFDVFDTLILRRVADPKDVFSIIGQKLGVLNYKLKREFAERVARSKKIGVEITLADICRQVYEIYGIDENLAYKLEIETEIELCTANKFFSDVFKLEELKDKHVIAVSDMYLPSEFIQQLITRCGFNISEVYVSCEYGCTKADGGLWNILRNKFKGRKIFHIGDNYNADMKACGAAGIKYYGVPNLNWMLSPYRECGVKSSVISLYSAQINALHTIKQIPSLYYYHGYVYGGILTYGFCKWLDGLAKDNKFDLFLFTARDCKVVYEVYKNHFSTIKSEYLYVSRLAALKLSFDKNFDMFFDIMFRAKALRSSKVSVEQALCQADLGGLIVKLGDYGIDAGACLNAAMLDKLLSFLLDNKQNIAKSFAKDKEAFLQYISPLIGNSKNICIVDLGWRGTVYSLLSDCFLENMGNLLLSCAMIGSADSDIPIGLIESGKLYAYAFSNRHNVQYIVDERKVVLLELLYSSSMPSVTGYEIEDGKGVPVFGKAEETEGSYFEDMHKGIYDFCYDFNKNINCLNYIKEITGAEAIAPIFKIYENQHYTSALFKKLKFSTEPNSNAISVSKYLKRI